VEEPPDKNHGCHDEQTEGLVAAEGSTLLIAPLIFGQLLLVGLDAAFDHACILPDMSLQSAGSPRISIGARCRRALSGK
jgi:hypothetical protein